MADYEELFLDTHSVSPSLFVGLGGSGSLIVDRIAEKLSRRWNWAQYQHLMAILKSSGKFVINMTSYLLLTKL